MGASSKKVGRVERHPVSQAQERWSWGRLLYPSEQIVLLSLLLSLCLSSWLDAHRLDLWALYQERILTLLPGYVSALLVTALVFRLRSIRGATQRVPLRETWVEFRGDYLGAASLLRDLRLLQNVTLLFVVFLSLKHLVPQVNKAVYDSTLLGLERDVFGNRLLSERLAHALPASVASPLSEVYHLFYPFIAVLLLAMVMQRDSLKVQEFFTWFCLTWLLGVLWVFLLPSWGPVFFVPESFTHLPLTGVSRMQEQLWAGKLALDSRREGALFLISGFPSLHFAVVCLGALSFHRLSRWFSIPALFFLVFTFISTLYFGWHYLLDHVGSLALVALARLGASVLHSSSTPAQVRVSTGERV